MTIVPVRPIRSPSTPKMKPPTDQPTRKAAVTHPRTVFGSSEEPAIRSRSSTDFLPTRLKRFWSIVSKSQPRPATASTIQQYRSSPRHQGRGWLSFTAEGVDIGAPLGSDRAGRLRNGAARTGRPTETICGAAPGLHPQHLFGDLDLL